MQKKKKKRKEKKKKGAMEKGFPFNLLGAVSSILCEQSVNNYFSLVNFLFSFISRTGYLIIRGKRARHKQEQSRLPVYFLL